MPITPAEAFEKRHIKRNDGDKVVPTSVALVAALESGYRFKLSDVEEAAVPTKYQGMLTKDEFVALCEKHPELAVSVKDMAKHVSVLAPEGFLTRASLQEASAKAGSSEDALNPDEVDALFTALDTNNTGSISAEQLMEAMYGEEGKTALEEQRKEYARMKRESAKKEEEDAAAAAAAEAEAEAKKKREAAAQKERSAAAAASAAKKPNEKPEPPAKKKTMCGC